MPTATDRSPEGSDRCGAPMAGDASSVAAAAMQASVTFINIGAYSASQSNGTDAPVEDVDPIASFYASVTRKMKSGEAFYPEQAMSRMEALKSYTSWCAHAAFEEDIKGTLTPGKLADIAVLSQDILTVPEDQLLDTRVLYTIVGGKVAYEAGK